MYKSILDYENDDNFYKFPMRPTLIMKKKKKIFNKMYKSKWANLKLYLKERKSLESSVKLRKKNTIDQFFSKCQEIYKKKVQIHLITKKNRQMFQSFNSTNDYIIQDISKKVSKIKILDAYKELEQYSNDLKNFLFSFRTNNELMLGLIECANKDQYEILVPFLCHFFYENFYTESNEQEEILYIIYLLLEKEIDSLYTPSVSTFLEQSFISNFLTEMGNRYEIKHYIDIILNNLIMEIEEINMTYNSMNILSNQLKKTEGVFYDMYIEDGFNYGYNYNNLYEKKNEINSKNMYDNIPNYKFEDKISKVFTDNKIKKSLFTPMPNYSLKGSTISINDIKNNSNYSSSIPLKKEINQDLFNNINEQYIRNKLEKEMDDVMKQFYVRQLRKIQAAKNKDLFNGNIYYEKLKKERKIYKVNVDEFNKSYNFIIKFINNLLTNLENNTIIPYSIKVICKFIVTLLNKRFKNITKIQCNILMCQFLFDKLIFPVLQNPDMNDAGKDTIISFNTRKTLSDIYDVCKKLVRGELFSINDRDYFVIFNKFIINNYHRINNIIDKITHVKEPEKLKLLSDKFYLTQDFKLEDLKRDFSEINYDGFEENLMQHRSICFSIKDLSILYDIVNSNKERFKDIGESFKKLSCIEELKNDKSLSNNYYMIISDEYNEEINELFNHEEKIALVKSKNIESIITNIKSCIEYVINNIEIFPNWKWII